MFVSSYWLCTLLSTGATELA